MQLNEQYNVEKLLKIITTPTIIDYLKDKYGYDIEDTTHTNTFTKHLTILSEQLDIDGKITMTYKQQKNTGRMYVSKMGDVNLSFGLQKIIRPIRQYLTRDDYVDIDMINCHPAILLYLCEKYDISTTYLRQYVLERDNVINDVMIFYNLDKSTCKTIFLQMMNLGSYKTWMTKNNLLKENDFIVNFQKEVRGIINKIVPKYPNIVKLKEKKPGQISLIYQEYEHQILMEAFVYLKEFNCIKDNICSLQFDGLQISKSEELAGVITELNKLMETRYKYITFKLKPLECDISEQEFKEAQNKLAENLYYYDYINLEQYLYGTHFEMYMPGKKESKVVVESNELSKFSLKFLKKWMYINIKKIDNSSTPYYIVRNEQIDEKLRKTIHWVGVKDDKLSCNINIKGILRDITQEEDLKGSEAVRKMKCLVYKIEKFSNLYHYFETENIKQVVDTRIMETFIPYLDEEKISQKIFNNFLGFSLNKIENTENINFEDTLIYKHIRDITCKGDKPSFEYLMKWIAQLIQHPEKKHRVALVQYGQQGSGKDTLIDFLQELVGNQFVYRTKQIKEFIGNFNSINSGKLIIGFNEVDDKSSKQNHDILKHVLDSREEIIERKYLPKFKQNCYKRFIFNTNNRNAFNVEDSNTRYFMLDTSSEKIGDYGYFQKIQDSINNEQSMKAAFDYFVNIDLTDFIVYIFPKTKYEKEQKKNNLKSPLQFLISVFEEDNICMERQLIIENKIDISNYSEISEIKSNDEKLDYIEYTAQDLYKDYKNYCTENCFKPFSSTNFKNEIFKACDISEKMIRGKSKYYGGKRTKYINLSTKTVYDKINNLVNKD